MPRSLKRFTPADIDKLRLMADFGHDGKSIARALDRPPQAIRVKCVELGIKLRPPSVEHRRVKLPLETWASLRRAAEARGTTIARLARLLIETIVRDDLFDAVIDSAPPAPRPKAKLKTVDPLAAALGKQPARCKSDRSAVA
jgi:hypothetical protein